MLIVLSPAKTLDFDSPLATRKNSQPRLQAETRELVDILATKTPDDIASMMSLSSNLAELNFERYQEWAPEFTTKTARPAVLAFKGDVYLGMEAETFSERDFTHAQKILRLLSGLYGVLRPLDLIQPYRLEMGTALENPRGKNLYGFWGDRITDLLNADLAERKSNVLVNLASHEYFSSVNPDRLEADIISPRFLDEKNGTHKVISFFAKRARGVMASWLIQNRVNTRKAIAEFDGMGYTFDAERSTRTEPTFVRAER